MNRATESVNSAPRRHGTLWSVLLAMWIVAGPTRAQVVLEETTVPNLPSLWPVSPEFKGEADAGLVWAGESVWIDQGTISEILNPNDRMIELTDPVDVGQILEELQEKSAMDLEALDQLLADQQQVRKLYFDSMATEMQAMLGLELVLPGLPFDFFPQGMIVGDPDFHELPAGFYGSPPVLPGGEPGTRPEDDSESSGLCGGAELLACEHPAWQARLRNAAGMLVRGDEHRLAVDQDGGTLFALVHDVQSFYLSEAQLCDLSETTLAMLAPWAQQPVLGTCGGVLIEHPKFGPGFLTARHCAVNGSGASLKSYLYIGDGAHLVFDFISENVTTPRSEGFMSRKSLRLAADTPVIVPEDPDIDLAFIPLARELLPEGVEILPLGGPRLPVSVGTEIFSYAFPLGTPMKAVAGPENVISVVQEDRMLVTLDNFKKSSGSPVFSIDGQLIGIFSQAGETEGDTDFGLLGDCFSPRQFDLTGQPEPWLPTVASVANLALPTIRIAGTVVSTP